MKTILGDCLEVMKTLPDKSIDMVLADPPYGTTACKWDSVIPFEPMWRELKRLAKTKAAICLFGSEPFSTTLRASNLDEFKYDWIWDTENKIVNFFNAKRAPLRRHEIVSVFGAKQYYPQKTAVNYKTRKYKKYENQNYYTESSIDHGREVSDGYPQSILKFKGKIEYRSLQHPTQKPVALLEYLIKTYTKPGEMVLDFCMGSGSTGVACVNAGRDFIGIEKDEKYFEIANRRIDAATITPLTDLPDEGNKWANR